MYFIFYYTRYYNQGFGIARSDFNRSLNQGFKILTSNLDFESRIQDSKIKLVHAKARLHSLVANFLGLKVLLLVNLKRGLIDYVKECFLRLKKSKLY